MKPLTPLILAGLCLVAQPVVAQDAADQKASILRALRLPTATREARSLGIPDQDIKTILATSKQDRIPVGVLTEAFEEQNKAVREHGPVDNFGAFVQEQLRSGLRGKDLAASIKAEHVAHGKGKDHVNAMGAKGAAHAVGAEEMAAEGKKKMNESMDQAGVQAKGASKGAAKAAAHGADKAKDKARGKSDEHGG